MTQHPLDKKIARQPSSTMSPTAAELDEAEASLAATIQELERIAHDHPMRRHRRKAAAGLSRGQNLLKDIQATRAALGL